MGEYLKNHSSHRKWHDLIGHISLPILVICSNNVSILQRFPDITTFTVYVTVSDLEKSFSLNETVDFEITRHVRFLIHV